jgi:nitroreductase
MDTLTAIASRSSATKLVEPAPSRAQVGQLLQAAVRAPDHGRLAPWRFAVLAGDARHVLGDAMAASLAARTPATAPEVLDGERRKALRAPLIIAVAAAARAHPKVPQLEQLLAVAAAIENLILAAHALGFGTMWKTGTAAYDPLVRSALGFESDDQILGFIYLGTAAALAPVREVDAGGVTRWVGAKTGAA